MATKNETIVTVPPVTPPLEPQAVVAEEPGFIGVKVDPEPNESYTLTGVTKGK